MSQVERRDLLAIYQAAIEGVNGRHAVQRYLELHQIEDDAPCYLISIGKAAASMAQGAFDQLDGRITRALVITRYGYGDPLTTNDRPIELIEAGHPQPDENSLKAGECLLSLLEQAPSDTHFIFLISGGTSALVEVLPPSFSLETLRRINRWLLGSGLAIDEINQVRCALSMIKGGRLIHYLRGRPALNLLMSDVPDDDPAVIGSGLLTAQPNSCPETVINNPPEWLQPYLDVEAVVANESVAAIETVIVAAAHDARNAAATAAEALGYRVHCHDRFIDGDAVVAGRQLITELSNSEPGVHIWSSETTVQLPDVPGQGGRCQQMALAAAQAMPTDSPLILLVAGSDGSDGGISQEEADAGAVVDSGTLRRGEIEGLDAEEALMQANAGAFLEASGDLISTGPTGANVMDLVIAYVS